MMSAIEREPGLDWAAGLFGFIALWHGVGIFAPRLRWKWSGRGDAGTRLGLLSTAGWALASGAAALTIYAVGRNWELMAAILPLFIFLGIIMAFMGKPSRRS